MAYKQMAYYYDTFMKHAPYDQWITFTQNIFQKYNKQVQTITDLGCGTGEVTLRLAKLNYDMIGIDYSPHMLTVADQKAFLQGQKILWMNQDLRDLSGLYDQDVILSYCDVINYVTDLNDLKIVFKNVYKSLAKDGLFIFDIHDFNYAKIHLINQTFADVDDDFTYVWFCHAGDHPGEMIHDITCFVKNEDGTFMRFTEVHDQRTFKIAVYEQLLKESGFRQIDIYNDFQIESSRKEADIKRRFFVAVK